MIAPSGGLGNDKSRMACVASNRSIELPATLADPTVKLAKGYPLMRAGLTDHACAMIVPVTNATPPTTASCPRIGINLWAASMPFCR